MQKWVALKYLKDFTGVDYLLPVVIDFENEEWYFYDILDVLTFNTGEECIKYCEEYNIKQQEKI